MINPSIEVPFYPGPSIKDRKHSFFHVRASNSLFGIYLKTTIPSDHCIKYIISPDFKVGFFDGAGKYRDVREDVFRFHNRGELIDLLYRFEGNVNGKTFSMKFTETSVL